MMPLVRSMTSTTGRSELSRMIIMMITNNDNFHARSELAWEIIWQRNQVHAALRE